jgi:uncharacterized phiE125 gp8 family phage protein
MQNVNFIKDTIDISDESGSVTEPVTLTEMKSYLRLVGFVDDNDSTSVDDFTDDDDMITEMITEAREFLEEELGISIVDHTWKAVGVTNVAGNVQLQYGPVKEISSILDEDGDTVETDLIELIGDFLDEPNYCDMTVTYTAGMDTVPKSLKSEIKRIVAYYYTHRGDEDGLKGYQISSQALKYSRRSWLE